MTFPANLCAAAQYRVGVVIRFCREVTLSTASNKTHLPPSPPWAVVALGASESASTPSPLLRVTTQGVTLEKAAEIAIWQSPHLSKYRSKLRHRQTAKFETAYLLYKSKIMAIWFVLCQKGNVEIAIWQSPHLKFPGSSSVKRCLCCRGRSNLPWRRSF